MGPTHDNPGRGPHQGKPPRRRSERKPAAQVAVEVHRHRRLTPVVELPWTVRIMDPLLNPQQAEEIRRFIHLLLFQVQQDQATELVIGNSSPNGVTIKCKIDGTWRELPRFPSHLRPDVVSELARMAHFHSGQIPGRGVLDERLGHIRLRWIVTIASADGDCVLKRIDD